MKAQGFDFGALARENPHQGGVHAIGGGSRHQADGQKRARVVHEGGILPRFERFAFP